MTAPGELAFAADFAACTATLALLVAWAVFLHGAWVRTHRSPEARALREIGGGR